jgi:hypothetical protein
MQIIFPRCGPQNGKIISIVGNNADYFYALWSTMRKMISVVGNNTDRFSAPWATTQKNYRHCRQQRKIFTTTRIYI